MRSLAVLAAFALVACTSEPPVTGDDDDSAPVGAPQPCDPPGACTLQTAFGDPATLEVVTEGIWAVWWDPAFDHADDAPLIIDQLEAIRAECLLDLGMADPPNPAAGFYYNVYIHHGADDSFPTGWGNGQGTDSFGMPFLTLPVGAHLDASNLFHEGFHVFQYSANSPGFAYSGDSQWYVESSAQWFSADHVDDDAAFIEVGAIASNPQLALWHSFGNEAPGDPTDWMFQVRQYGMHSWLYYLTSVVGVDPARVTEGFYAGTDLSPQAWHLETIGAAQVRAAFGDWAAANTAGFPYLEPSQVTRAWLEVELAGDPDNAIPYVLELVDEGVTDFAPETIATARGWAYNVIRVESTTAADWTLTLNGADFGVEGAPATFEARALVLVNGEPTVTPLALTDGRDGSVTVSTPAGASELFLVVASVPDTLTGNQIYPWSASIQRSAR